MADEWTQALAVYTAWMLAAGVAETTLRIYTHYLLRLEAAAQVEPFSVTIDHLVVFVGRRRWQPATRKSARAAVRSFYSWAQQTGRMQDNPAFLLRPVRVQTGLPRPCPEAVLERALRRAVPRDRLMLMLAAYAGMRRGEIAVAHSRDVMGDVIRVHGKGGKVRDVPLHPVLITALSRWPAGYLFPGLVDGHMSPDRVGHIGTELLEDGWTLHTLRHRFLTLAYSAERDARAVQTLAGHAKLDTTMIYTKVPDGALHRAVLAAGPAVAADAAA
jgi:integrase/recombinase XerC